jgi:transcriptional regulator with XRE-family HTH domain
MNNILAQRLREKRKKYSLTLAQVSERIDISISFLSDIELGRGNPSLATLEKLADCYQTTIAELYIGSDVRYVKEIRLRILEQTYIAIGLDIEKLEADLREDECASEPMWGVTEDE